MKRTIRLLSIGLVLAILFAALVPGVALADPGWYVVKPGDTLYSIGRCFGVSPYAIAAANCLANPNYIRVGQVLRIPAGGASAPAAPVWSPAPSRPAQVPAPYVPPQAPQQVGGVWIWVSHTYYGPGSHQWTPAPVKVWWPYNTGLEPVLTQVWGSPAPAQTGGYGTMPTGWGGHR